MNEYSNLDLRGDIPDFPPDRKRLILKEGSMRLVEKQVKVGSIWIVYHATVKSCFHWKSDMAKIA